jgi:hypothetical protein
MSKLDDLASTLWTLTDGPARPERQPPKTRLYQCRVCQRRRSDAKWRICKHCRSLYLGAAGGEWQASHRKASQD